MRGVPSCDAGDDSAKLAAFRTDKTPPVTPRISILPKRRLLATAVALVVSGTAWQAQAQAITATNITTTSAASTTEKAAVSEVVR